jgi:uncharacterized membrane protein YesL
MYFTTIDRSVDKRRKVWYDVEYYNRMRDEFFMHNILNSDGFFWRWFGKLADVLVLSLLWVLCCLPILTIAPSCIALYDTVARCIHGTEDQPYRHFFRVLKNELLRGIGITVLWLAVGVALMFGYNVLYNVGKEHSFFAIYSMVYLATMLIPLGIFAWLVPLQARFTHSFFGLHKTAATFAIVHLPTTGIVLGILAAAIAIGMLVPVLVFILPGLVITLQCWFIEKVFKRYIPEEENNDD